MAGYRSVIKFLKLGDHDHRRSESSLTTSKSQTHSSVLPYKSCNERQVAYLKHSCLLPSTLYFDTINKRKCLWKATYQFLLSRVVTNSTLNDINKTLFFEFIVVSTLKVVQTWSFSQWKGSIYEPFEPSPFLFHFSVWEYEEKKSLFAQCGTA